MSRPRATFVAAEIALLCAAAAIGVFSAPTAHWNLGLLASLLVLSVASDFLAVTVRGRIRISGSFLALVLAMVFLGGAPAAAIGVVTILVGRLRWHEPSRRGYRGPPRSGRWPTPGPNWSRPRRSLIW